MLWKSLCGHAELLETLMQYVISYLTKTYLVCFLKVSMYVSNKPPQNGKSSPAAEETQHAEGKSVTPLHVHDGGHRILDEPPFMLSHVTWVQVAGAVF
jgi:hypothetical protein